MPFQSDSGGRYALTVLDKHRYSAFGLAIDSDLALPELPARQELTAEPVSIQAGDHRQWPPLACSPHSTPTLHLGAGDWRLQLEGIGWFRAAGGHTLEWQRWDDSVSDRDLRTFLVTSGLGAIAIQRGALALHGTALEHDGQGVLLLGHPAAGKSTLAWCLLRHGWRLLSSELVVVDRQGMIWPGLQQIKLWQDAAVELGEDWQHLAPVRRGLKRYACLPPQLICSEQSVPLRCTYVLHRAKDQGEPNQDKHPTLICASNAFAQQQALLSLRNMAFQARAVRGMAMEFLLFTQAAALARTVPMHRLEVPLGIKAMAAAVDGVDLLHPASLQRDDAETSNG